MIGNTNRATMMSAISQGLQPDCACSSRFSCLTALVAAESSVLPAGNGEDSFALSFSSVAAAAVERGALSAGGAAVAAGAASAALVAGADDFSAACSAAAAVFFPASFADSAGADFASASVFAEPSAFAAGAGGADFCSWAKP